MNTPTVVSYTRETDTTYGILTQVTQSRCYIVLASQPDHVTKIPAADLKYMTELTGCNLNRAKATIRKFARSHKIRLPANVREVLR